MGKIVWLGTGFILMMGLAGCGLKPMPTLVPTTMPIVIIDPTLPRPSRTPTVEASETVAATTRQDFPPPQIRVFTNTIDIAQNIADLAWAPDGKSLAWARVDYSGAATGPVVFDLITKQIVWTAGSDTAALAFSPDASLLATGSEGGLVELWDAHTGERVQKVGTVPGKITTLGFNRDGTLIGAGAKGDYQGGEGSVTVFETASGNKRVTLPSYGAVTKVVFPPDGKALYFAGEAQTCGRGGGSVFKWDGESAEAQPFLLTGGNSVTDLVLDTSGKRFASVGIINKERCKGNAIVTIWDANTGSERKEIPLLMDEGSEPQTPLDATVAAFSRDGKFLIAGDSGGNLQIIDWANAKVLRILDVGTGGPRWIEFSPDGAHFVYEVEGNIRVYPFPLP